MSFDQLLLNDFIHTKDIYYLNTKYKIVFDFQYSCYFRAENFKHITNISKYYLDHIMHNFQFDF